MSRKPRIVIDPYPIDDLARTYSVNVRLSSTTYYEDRGRPVGASQQLGREPLNEKEQWLVNELHSIDGVISVSIKTYEVRIHIGRAFDWDEIDLQVIIVIAKYLGWEEFEIRGYGSHDD